MKTSVRGKPKSGGTGTLDVMAGIRWQEQATADAVNWLDVNGGVTGRDKVAYAAGHAKGWADALSALAMQGIIVRFDRKGEK